MRALGRLEHLKFVFLLHCVELALLSLVTNVVQVVQEAFGLKLCRWVLHALMSTHGLIEVEKNACCRLMLTDAVQSIILSIFRIPRIRQFHLSGGLGRHLGQWENNRATYAVPVLGQL